MIFEVFLYLNDTIDNNDNNVQEVEKDNEVCRDFVQDSVSVSHFFGRQL